MRIERKQVNRIVFGISLLVFFAVVIILIPFGIEWILFNETTFPFSYKIRFSRPEWFSFLGSYVGAVATIILGVITLKITERNQKLSEDSQELSNCLQERICGLVQENANIMNKMSHVQDETQRLIMSNNSIANSLTETQQQIKNLVETTNKLTGSIMSTQEKIRDMVNSNNELTESILEIPRVIFRPILSFATAKFKVSSSIVKRDYNPNDADVSHAFADWDYPEGTNPETVLDDGYKFITLKLFNDGEKTIVSLHFISIKPQNGDEIDGLYANWTDVKPNEEIDVLLALKEENFAKIESALKDGQYVTVTAELFNPMGDKYIMRCNICYDDKLEEIELYERISIEKTVCVAAAVIKSEKDGKPVIFATQRGIGEFKDKWEFPGGKIHEGESPRRALIREILEELGSEIVIDEYIATIEYDYPEYRLSMECYWCTLVKGDLELKEHKNAIWLNKDDLDDVDWLPADKDLIEKIRENL